MSKGILSLLEEYDAEQDEYIRKLEQEVIDLRQHNSELVSQLADYVGTVDRMKLDLIMGGMLVSPSGDPVPAVPKEEKVAPLSDKWGIFIPEQWINGVECSSKRVAGIVAKDMLRGGFDYEVRQKPAQSPTPAMELSCTCPPETIAIMRPGWHRVMCPLWKETT